MADAGANIIESQQHSSDPVGGVFTLRLEFVLADLAAPAGRAGAGAGRAGGGVAVQLAAGVAAQRRPRLAVFVSTARPRAAGAALPGGLR